MEQQPQEYQHFVRIMNTDLDGKKSIKQGLTKIRGISIMYSNMVCKLADVDMDKKTGLLSQAEIERINDVILNPDKYKVPVWMRNRRNDYETGVTKHLFTSDLDFAREQDLRRLKKIKSYRGVRHTAGLTVRGQRTKSNFRRNKGKVVGVMRKKVEAAAGGKE